MKTLTQNIEIIIFLVKKSQLLIILMKYIIHTIKAYFKKVFLAGNSVQKLIQVDIVYSLPGSCPPQP